YYRERGFNPLPSAMDHKKPLVTYAHLWETRAPDHLFTEDVWPATTNVQVMCGSAWRLLVVDLDGAEARERWDAMGHHRDTWITHRAGGESFHVWFKVPRWFKGEVRSGF